MINYKQLFHINTKNRTTLYEYDSNSSSIQDLFNLGVKYEKTVEAILGRWTDIATIHRIPERPELFSESWLRAESIRELGDQEIIRIFDSISRIVRNEVPKPLKYKRFLRRVG